MYFYERTTAFCSPCVVSLSFSRTRSQKERHSKPNTPEFGPPGGDASTSSVEVTNMRTLHDNNINNHHHNATVAAEGGSPVEIRRGSELVIQNLMEEPTVRQHVVFSHQHSENEPRRLTPRSPTIEWPARRPEGPPPLPPRSLLLLSPSIA